MDGEPGLTARASLTGRLLFAWGDLRGSMRAVLAARPREGTLLVLAMASGAVFFLGRAAGIWLSPEAASQGEDALIGQLQNELVGALIFRTLMLYAVAAFAGLVAKALGGTGSWADSRAATFWSALVAAPVVLVATIAAAMLDRGGADIGFIPQTIGQLFFAWAFAACLAEAHGFSSTIKVLGVLAVAGLLVIAPLYFFN